MAPHHLSWQIASPGGTLSLSASFFLVMISPSYPVPSRLPCSSWLSCFILEQPGFISIQSCKHSLHAQWVYHNSLCNTPPHTGPVPPQSHATYTHIYLVQSRPSLDTFLHAHTHKYHQTTSVSNCAARSQSCDMCHSLSSQSTIQWYKPPIKSSTPTGSNTSSDYTQGTFTRVGFTQ